MNNWQKTIEEIQIDEKWGFLENKPFPKLSIMNQEELEGILRELAHGKAIKLDGLSDKLCKEQNIKKNAKILKDLWSIDLSQVRGIKASLTSRLVPLNKVFPNVPTRRQMRPIMVCSILQKILEARFFGKLMDYLQNKMVASQTGFVPGMGIQVNLLRAICRIKMATEENKQCKLFIDFANAYNTVPHTLLFQKLRAKQCLDEEELRYLEALYANYRIRIGNKKIRYNRGVAQGSIISPALFDIFVEDLVDELIKVEGITIEDVLLYADDILILYQTQSQIKQCTEIIEELSKKNGMELNKKKSGILPFAPRMAKDIPLMTMEKIYDKHSPNKIIS